MDVTRLSHDCELRTAEASGDELWITERDHRRDARVHVRVPVASIRAMRACDGYTELITESGKTHLIEVSIRQLHARYPEFVQVHRNALVRPSAIVEIRNSAEGRVVVIPGHEFAISRRQGYRLMSAVHATNRRPGQRYSALAAHIDRAIRAGTLLTREQIAGVILQTEWRTHGNW